MWYKLSLGYNNRYKVVGRRVAKPTDKMTFNQPQTEYEK